MIKQNWGSDKYNRFSIFEKSKNEYFRERFSDEIVNNFESDDPEQTEIEYKLRRTIICGELSYTRKIIEKEGSLKKYEKTLQEVIESILIESTIFRAELIIKEIGEGIDFSDAIKKAFNYILVFDEDLPIAKKIKKKLGKGIDFKEEIMEAFFHFSSRERDIFYAKRIRKTFGKNIEKSDFIKYNFGSYLIYFQREDAEPLYEKYKDTIDFTEEIKKGYLSALEYGEYEEAEYVEEAYGEGINLHVYVSNFKDKIKKGFLIALDRGAIYDAEGLKKMLPGVNLDKEIKKCFLTNIGLSERTAKSIYKTFRGEIDFMHEIKDGFTHSLKHNNVSAAYNIHEFTKAEYDCTEDLQTVFETYISDGNLFTVHNILKQFKGFLDFPEIIKTQFLSLLEKGRLDRAQTLITEFRIEYTTEDIKRVFNILLNKEEIRTALRIKQKYDNFGEFTKECIANAEAIKKTFSEYLSENRIKMAIDLKINLGEGIDFSQEIKLHEKDILQSFSDALNMIYNEAHIDLPTRDIGKILEYFGKHINLTYLIKSFIRDWLQEGNIDKACRLKKDLGEGINMGDKANNAFEFLLDMKDKVKEAFDILLEDGSISKAILLKDKLGEGVDFSDSINKFKDELRDEKIDKGEVIGTWLRDFSNYLGFEKAFKLTFTFEFWDDIHDNLLFVNKFISEDEEKNNKTRIIFQNIFVSGMDFQKFNQYIGSFDLEAYEEMNSLVPIKNWDEFIRICLIHKNNIHIPTDASDSFQEALTELIGAPGVDVSFLKNLVEDYKISILGESRLDTKKEPFDKGRFYNTVPLSYRDNSLWHSPYRDEFSSDLIDIIEGENDIDERQVIRPFEEIIPFDPMNKLVFSALGINEINRESIEYSKKFKGDENLKAIITILIEYNKKVKEEIKEKYRKLIYENKDKKAKYQADMDKELDNMAVLQYEGGSKLKGINYMQLEPGFIDVDIQEQLKDNFYSFLSDEDNRLQLLGSLYNLLSKKDILLGNLELVHFEELVSIGENLFEDFDIEGEMNAIRAKKGSWKEKVKKINNLKREKFKSISFDKLKDILLPGKEISILIYMIYLGYNNLKKQAESRNLNKKLMEIINTPKYLRELDRMQEKGIIKGRMRPLQAYIDGVLQLEEEDVDRLKEVLKGFGYDNMGRSLKVEIAKKSDPRGWVCGDYTNCCMPFTSGKNKEYLLREDMSYFLVSIVDEHGNEDIVGQSVLVAAGKEKENGTIGKFKVLAIDNIEIANRAIKYRAIIAQAYTTLKEKFSDKKIIIGTTYNDDGGAVTGQCEMEPLKHKPLKGKMKYSDCFGNLETYTFHDPKAKEKTYKYFPVQIDNIEVSELKQRVSREDLAEIKILLEKIGRGEDDGEGGQYFADNYSALIKTKEGYKGYIVAADYLVEPGEDNNLVIEKLGFEDSVTIEEKRSLLEDYAERKGLKGNINVDLDRLKINLEGIRGDDMEIIKEVFAGYKMKEKKNHLTIKIHT